jgi:protein-disulfide isomerase
VGLDVDRLKVDMNRVEISRLMEQDLEDAKFLGIRGTPTFFINGKAVSQFGYPALKAQLNRALAETTVP